MESIRELANRWDLSAHHIDKVMDFAWCWAKWIIAKKELENVKAETYLDFAEPFVTDFLSGMCTGGRGSGSFAGIIVVANTAKAFANELALHLDVSLYLSTANKDQRKGTQNLNHSLRCHCSSEHLMIVLFCFCRYQKATVYSRHGKKWIIGSY